MTKKIYLMFLSVFLSVTYLSAQVVQTVNVPSAGGLATAIGSNLKTVTDLTLTGTINATDFNTIKQMTALKNLDMSQVAVMDNAIPANAFQGRVMNSLVLPEGLEVIGEGSFKGGFSLNTDLVLPSSIKQISSWAFQDLKTKVDFSKVKNSLSTVGQGFVERYTGSNLLDFSDFKLFLNSYGSAFYDYSGHVVLPTNMVNLPANMFNSFKGTVALPEGLKRIGISAFQSSIITKIDLPAGVTSIGTNAFYNATKLDTIISRNTTPPTLGTNVFYGVNKETTALEVPSESINLYGSAAQWKDFLNISGRIPSKVELLYHIGIGHVAGGIDNMGVNTDEYGVIEVPYEAVRIGEYYWMTNNFNHEEPLRKRWTMTVSGDEADRHMTQEDLDTYFQRMHANESQFQVDITDYNKTFGNYYSPNSVKYMDNWAKIFENGSTQNNDQWGLPQMKDFRQLIGMSPFMALNTTTELTVHDAMTALCAGRSRYPILKNKIMDNCGGTWNYWADYGDRGGDKYGFGFTPSGNRSNGVYTQRFMAESSPNVKCYDDYVQMDRGELIQLFHRGQLAGSDSYMSFHEVIDTRQWQQDSHWLPIRWCRPLSNEELGYRLYLNINNIDKKSNQWTSLANGDEIPLLNYMRNNNIPTDQTSILKLGLSETAPEGYIELPHGYIRGFYVQYLLDNPNTNLEVSNIMKYAYGVQDEALEYRQEEGRPSPTTTRSLESDDVVVPFKADASVALYPNPVQDVLNISGDGVEKVTIYDMSGRQVSTAKNVNTISVSDLSKGTYLVRVLTANGESTHKVIKK